jgi:hypothetical protein
MQKAPGREFGRAFQRSGRLAPASAIGRWFGRFFAMRITCSSPAFPVQTYGVAACRLPPTDWSS